MFMNIVTKFIFCISLSFSVFAGDDISSFKSDGCSAFPDGTIQDADEWVSCCTAHDLAYWKGGTYSERFEADKELQVCVNELGHSAISFLMLAGVRVGGTPFIPSGFRWGYGWPFPRSYRELSAEEKIMIDVKLKGIVN